MAKYIITYKGGSVDNPNPTQIVDDTTKNGKALVQAYKKKIAEGSFEIESIALLESERVISPIEIAQGGAAQSGAKS